MIGDEGEVQLLTYIVMPCSILYALRGDARALQVLCCLIANRNTRTNNTHFLPVTLISEFTGISRSWCYKLLKKLEGNGLIKCVAERRSEYMWHLPFLKDIGTEKSETDLEEEISRLMAEVNEIGN